MYKYKAKVIRVISGDSLEAELDLGFNVSIREIIRLAHVTAPSVRGEKKESGLKSRDAMAELLLEQGGYMAEYGTDLTVNSLGKDQYGRYVAEITVGEYEIIDIGEYMLKNNFAVLYRG